MKYIRVSEILARLQDFSHVDVDVLTAKQKLGCQVHHAITEDAQGMFPLLETPRAASYFSSYLLWKRDVKPLYKMQETRLYDDELRITGQIDALIGMGNGSCRLVDWKCSANISEEIWMMQAHFYWYLLRQNKIDVSTNFEWVNLRSKKVIEGYDEEGAPIITYHPLKPRCLKFDFQQNILSRCLDEAIKAWEEKKTEELVDFNAY
jgi:hypothetical protein